MEPWEHVVEIPEGKVGDYEIKHIYRDPGKVERSNARTALMGGQSEKPLEFDRRTQWHQLSYDGGVWMTDLPIEQQQHDNELKVMTYGDVLIGGLGVGYAANVLAARDEVDRIVVVEISPEVCKLVEPHLKDPWGKIEVVNMDLFKFLKQNEEPFDWAFYDIWQSDGEGTFHTKVIPLRELSWGCIDDENIVCWNENVMRGQLVTGLHTRFSTASAKNAPIAREDEALKKFLEGYPTFEQLAEPRPKDADGAHYWNWSCPFWKAVLEGVVDGDNFYEMAGAYAGTYGRYAWRFWWDRVVRTGAL